MYWPVHENISVASKSLLAKKTSFQGMGLIIFKSSIIKPHRSWRIHRRWWRWQVPETTTTWVTDWLWKERIVSLSGKPSFHISQRSQTIIFLYITSRPCTWRWLHSLVLQWRKNQIISGFWASFRTWEEIEMGFGSQDDWLVEEWYNFYSKVLNSWSESERERAINNGRIEEPV